MREIKFRGYDLDREEWRYGSLDRDLEQNEYYITDEYEGIGRNVEEDSIGQYTGLKDKNGVEIYEGDIVKNYYYIDTPDGEQERYHLKEIKFNNINCEYNIDAFENIEVIGNIYDNPELIEKEGK